MIETARILIADDEEIFRETTAELLRREGFAVATVGDAAGTVKELSTDDFDLILADIKMPGNANLEMIQDLSEMKLQIPTILVTGYPTLNTAIESVCLPIDAYLIKPVEVEDLIRTIRRCLIRHRAVQSMTNADQSLEQWLVESERLGQSVASADGDSLLVGMEAYVEMTTRNMGRCLNDLKNITTALGKNSPPAHPCHLLSCPTLESLTGAIVETIQVLEKTKHAFRSKDLGQLRKKLEGIVEQLPRSVSS